VLMDDPDTKTCNKGKCSNTQCCVDKTCATWTNNKCKKKKEVLMDDPETKTCNKGKCSNMQCCVKKTCATWTNNKCNKKKKVLMDDPETKTCNKGKCSNTQCCAPDVVNLAEVEVEVDRVVVDMPLGFEPPVDMTALSEDEADSIKDAAAAQFLEKQIEIGGSLTVDDIEFITFTQDVTEELEMNLPFDLDLASQGTEATQSLKDGAVSSGVATGAYALEDVAEVELTQDTIRRARRADNPPINAKIVFKPDSVDPAAAETAMTAAIDSGSFKVSAEINGETISATITDLPLVESILGDLVAEFVFKTAVDIDDFEPIPEGTVYVVEAVVAGVATSASPKAADSLPAVATVTVVEIQVVPPPTPAPTPAPTKLPEPEMKNVESSSSSKTGKGRKTKSSKSSKSSSDSAEAKMEGDASSSSSSKKSKKGKSKSKKSKSSSSKKSKKGKSKSKKSKSSSSLEADAAAMAATVGATQTSSFALAGMAAAVAIVGAAVVNARRSKAVAADRVMLLGVETEEKQPLVAPRPVSASLV